MLGHLHLLILALTLTDAARSQYIDSFGPPSLSQSFRNGSTVFVHPGSSGKVYVTNLRGIEGFNNGYGPFRLLPDGSLDPSFGTEGFFGNASALVELRDGRILVGGSIQPPGSRDTTYLVRLTHEGRYDPSFNAEHGFSADEVFEGPDLGIWVFGSFPRHIAKLKPDGSLDTTFDPGSGIVNGSPLDIAFRPNGRVLVVGAFANYNGTSVRSIVQLLPDGSIDPQFTPPFWPSAGGIHRVLLHPNGYLYMGGDFLPTGSSSNKRHLYRFNSNGIQDKSFDPDFDETIEDIALLDDGRLVLVGRFTAVAGRSRDYLAVMTPDGAIVDCEPRRPGPDNYLLRIAQTGIGHFVVTGPFSNVNGLGQKNVSAARVGEPFSGGPPVRLHLWSAGLGAPTATVECRVPTGATHTLQFSSTVGGWQPYGSVWPGTGGIRLMSQEEVSGAAFFRRVTTNQ